VEESGSSTPHLRELLTLLQSLVGSTLRVSSGSSPVASGCGISTG